MSYLESLVCLFFYPWTKPLRYPCAKRCEHWRVPQRLQRILSSPLPYLFKTSRHKDKFQPTTRSPRKYQISRSSTHLWPHASAWVYIVIYWKYMSILWEETPSLWFWKRICIYEILTHQILKFQRSVFDCTASRKDGLGTFLVKTGIAFFSKIRSVFLNMWTHSVGFAFMRSLNQEQWWHVLSQICISKLRTLLSNNDFPIIQNKGFKIGFYILQRRKDPGRGL